jgi:hypothetical protein
MKTNTKTDKLFMIYQRFNSFFCLFNLRIYFNLSVKKSEDLPAKQDKRVIMTNMVLINSRL